MPLSRETPASSPPPSAFGRYRVVHQVGAGVLGPVFRGYDPEHDRAVAIKAFSLDLTPEQSRDLAAGLSRLPLLPLKHSSIIAPYAAGVEGSTAYLVQEYFVAESADIALKQYGPAPVPDAMRLIGQLAGALDFAAAAGVHHGALHPRDILVAPHEVRLSGLGVVEALEGVGYRPPVRRPYAPPERASGVTVTCQTDVFSLAGVAYELLTGRRPSVSGDAVLADTESIPAASGVAVAEVFARALSARPDDRFWSALAFAASLKHALTGEPLLAGETVDRPKTRRAPRAARGKDAAEPKAAAPADLLTDATPAAQEPAAVPAVAAAEPPLAAVEPAPLPSTPPPGSTPLPSFLESYRPAVGEAATSEAPAALASIKPADEVTGLAPSLPEVENGPIASPSVRPDLDLDEIDRRTEMTTAIPIVRLASEPAAALPDERPVAPASDGFEPRVETTEVRTASGAEAEAAPLHDEPVQPAFNLEDPGRRDEPQRELPMFGSEPPVVSSGESRRRSSWVSLAGMLLVGLLIGLVLGRYVVTPSGAPGQAAPAVTGAPAAASSQSSQPAPSPAEPLTAAAPAPATGAPSNAAPAVEPPRGGAPTPSPAKSIEAASARPADAAAAKPAAPPAAKPGGATSSRTSKPAAGRTAAAPGAKSAATGAPAAAGAKTLSKGKFEGSLVVASKPAGATVHLDGREVGTTPATLQAVPAGAHAIRIELAGYQVWSSSVQVTAGKVVRVTASLERRPGG